MRGDGRAHRDAARMWEGVFPTCVGTEGAGGSLCRSETPFSPHAWGRKVIALGRVLGGEVFPTCVGTEGGSSCESHFFGRVVAIGKQVPIREIPEMFKFKARAENGEVLEGEVQALDSAQTLIEVRWLVGPRAVVLQLWQVRG